MTQYGIECTVGQKPGDMESSIIEHVTSVEPKHQENVSRNKEHDDIQMPKNTGLTGWLKRGSTEGS